MRLKTLNQEFRKTNPTGVIIRNDRRGDDWFIVWFQRDSKGYNYRANSVYELAERLNMIPEIDIPFESRRIIEVLQNETEVIAPAGCSDTVRMHWGGDGIVVEQSAGVDEYDRAIARYSVGSSEWV